VAMVRCKIPVPLLLVGLTLMQRARDVDLMQRMWHVDLMQRVRDVDLMRQTVAPTIALATTQPPTTTWSFQNVASPVMGGRTKMLSYGVGITGPLKS
jgi:hypothetical protein